MSFVILDARTENWPLVEYTSPFILVLLYLFIVLWFGPWLMAFRKRAFNLRNFMIIYNTLLVLLNAYIAQILIKSAWALNYDIFCQHISYSNDPLEIQVYFTLLGHYCSDRFRFVVLLCIKADWIRWYNYLRIKKEEITDNFSSCLPPHNNAILVLDCGQMVCGW